jgi:hypothetical protein
MDVKDTQQLRKNKKKDANVLLQLWMMKCSVKDDLDARLDKK